MDGFRPGGHLSFDRLPDGSVVMMRLEKTLNKKERVRFSHVITPDVWAELISYVSKAGHPTMPRVPANVQLAELFHAGRVGAYKKLDE